MKTLTEEQKQTAIEGLEIAAEHIMQQFKSLKSINTCPEMAEAVKAVWAYYCKIDDLLSELKSN